MARRTAGGSRTDTVATGWARRPQRQPCGARYDDRSGGELRSQDCPGSSLPYRERQASTDVLEAVMIGQPGSARLWLAPLVSLSLKTSVLTFVWEPAQEKSGARRIGRSKSRSRLAKRGPTILAGGGYLAGLIGVPTRLLAAGLLITSREKPQTSRDALVVTGTLCRQP